jgi:hypothetical protein
VKTYDLRKGMRVLLKDGRTAEMLDSARRLARLVRTGHLSSEAELVCSYDIVAYIGKHGTWCEDLEYSKEEKTQRARNKS